MNQPNIQVDLDPKPHSWRYKLKQYALLIRLNKPIGIYLLLWPALWALWIAGDGNPPWSIALIFILGTSFMRSAGCAINDYADRHIDGKIKRTKNRPLAIGSISPKEALAVFFSLLLASFLLVLLLNWQTIAFAFLAAFFATLYPFMKRFTHWPQLFLGLAFACAIPMAFLAITEQLPFVSGVLFVATVIWALIYDTQYAMVDREDDIKIGVKSTAILFAKHDRLIIGILQITMLSLLVWIGLLEAFNWVYYAGLAVAAGFALQQQALIKHREPNNCFLAFINNNCYGMSIFFGIAIQFLI